MGINQVLKLLRVTLLLLLAACSAGEPTSSGSDFPGEISAAELVTATPPESEAIDFEDEGSVSESECVSPYFTSSEKLPGYQLDTSVNLARHAVSVQERVVYPNTSPDALEAIPLIVEPSRIRNVFSLSEVMVGREGHKHFSLKDGVLEIRLAAPLPPGCAVEIGIDFNLSVPGQDGLFGFTDEQMMLTNWFPFVPPYQYDQKWLVHPPARYGEHLVYSLADFAVSLDFEQEIGADLVAAPAPATVVDGRIVYQLNHARTFSLAILPDHRRISRAVDGVEFHVYFKPGSGAAAQAGLDTMVTAVEVFSELFGEYPFDSLTTAEIEMYDGMEYDGIFFLGRDVFPEYNHTSRNIFTLLVAHETAHNWWFSQVANDQALEPWLDEAICTYSELLYLERVHPELVDWWWNFRVLDADPLGPVDVSIYDYFDYERYRQSVYLRGALFFEAVRGEMGEDAFFGFLQKYYQAGVGKIASAELFFAALDQASDADIDAVIAEFFKDP